jgi:hypothetical protein
MNVVLETNVLVSALLSRSGPPAEIVRRWEAGQFEVLLSPVLLQEVERALRYPRVADRLSWSEETRQAFLRRLGAVAVLVDPDFQLEILAEDPDDNRVVECALTGGAAFIITGDQHLLGLEEYAGIVILSPAGFLAFLDQEANQG